MQSLFLPQLFGRGAFQDENVLIIQKSSLLKLTPLLQNSATSLFTAILMTGLLNFEGVITDENNQPLTDEKYQLIFYDNSESFEFLKMIEWNPFVALKASQPYIMHEIIINSYVKN